MSPYAVKKIVHHYDWHATLPHCFGLDHTKLGDKPDGSVVSRTDGQEALVITELPA